MPRGRPEMVSWFPGDPIWGALGRNREWAFSRPRGRGPTQVPIFPGNRMFTVRGGPRSKSGAFGRYPMVNRSRPGRVVF